MEQDYENQYFQEYSIFSNPQCRSFDINQEDHCQNSFLAALKEPLSEESSPHHFLQVEQEIHYQPDKSTPKTADVLQINPLSVSQDYNLSIVFEEAACQRYKMAFQGTKDDTVELNINFKTLLVNYFKELALANQLNAVEIKRINQFANRGPSFHSLKELFKRQPGNDNIRALGLRLLTSSDCIKKVMTGRSKLRTKIQMVKYIQKIRANILAQDEIIKWKDVIRKPN